jgi:hypothetical protein
VRQGRRTPRRADSPSPTSLAGWLFADLALLLFIITVVVVADFPADAPEAPAAIESPSPTPEPSPSPTAEPGVEPRPHEFIVHTDAAGIIAGDSKAVDALVTALEADFAALVDQGYKVGFALTFGGADDPGYGGDLAEAANKILARSFPDLFADAPTRSFWTSSNKDGYRVGTLEIELYLLAI